MHICIIADGRSPITHRWIAGCKTNHKITLISTFPCAPHPGVFKTFWISVAFSRLAGNQVNFSETNSSPQNRMRQIVARSRSLFLTGRYLLGPLTLPYYAIHLRQLLNSIQPDVVHAMRIPFEGMLASYTPPGIPLVISVWGNDLTLHVHGSALMKSATARSLIRADGLIADSRRDLRLAVLLGFSNTKPMQVVPGSGGIDLDEIIRLQSQSPSQLIDTLPAGVPIVINPRGFRPGSVRNDVFFQAIPLLIQRLKKPVHFVCVAMAGQVEAIQQIKQLHLEECVHLLPFLPQEKLFELFMCSDISVSISAHDGTPNTLLESMALGCFPIAGDIESIREWIIPGVNGLLVEPSNPHSLAEALLKAIEQPNLRKIAAELNLNLIRSRAEVADNRSQIEAFYQKLINE